MKTIKLFHNPGAGNEELTKKQLIKLIEANGFICEYSSTKKKHNKEFEPHHDIIAIAGGDGTVRGVIKSVLARTMLDKRLPIALLPQGTANNISKTLNIETDVAEVFKRWKKGNIKLFDVGSILGIKKHTFFMEGFGFGIFPYLMLEMKKVDPKEIDTAEKSLAKALDVLKVVVEKYKPHYCSVQIDGVDYSGKYVLAEIMNTKSIGPNLFLAPDNQTDDGLLEVVLVSEEDKSRFADYVASKIKGDDERFTFKSIKAKNIQIAWDGKHVHVDDEIIKLKKMEQVKIEIREGVLGFIV